MSLGAVTIGKRRGGISRSARRILVFLGLLVFTYQCILVQSHVHGPQTAPPKDHSVSISAPAAPAGPDNDDPKNCPLCQEMLHAGSYVAPVAIAIYQPVVMAFVAAPSLVTILHISQSSHDWRGRGPPRI